MAKMCRGTIILKLPFSWRSFAFVRKEDKKVNEVYLSPISWPTLSLPDTPTDASRDVMRCLCPLQCHNYEAIISCCFRFNFLYLFFFLVFFTLFSLSFSISLLNSFCLSLERERDRQRKRETDQLANRDTDRNTPRDRETEKGGLRQTFLERQRETRETERNRDRRTQSERQKGKNRKTEKEVEISLMTQTLIKISFLRWMR